MGKTLALDARNATQIYQVRICVEIDLNTSFPNQIKVGQKFYNLIFENLHVFDSTFSSVPWNYRKSNWTFDRPVDVINGQNISKYRPVKSKGKCRNY